MWKDEKYSAVVRALDGALPIPEECLHPCTSNTITPESQPVLVKEEPTENPTEDPLIIHETQIEEITTIPETQIISLSKHRTNIPKNIPEEQIITIKDEATCHSNNTKSNEPVTEIIVITDSSDDSDDTVEELKTLLTTSPANIGKGRPMDMRLYKDFIPEVVEKIPHNINGLHHYMIDCREDENPLDWQNTGMGGTFT